MKAKMKVTMLAPMTAKSLMMKPWTVHKATPSTNIEYINKEIPEVSLVLMTWMAWGINDALVRMAAMKPMFCITCR